MILITQQTTLPRIVRGLAIELNPNRSGSTVTQVAGLIPLVTGETDCRGPLSECFIAYADLSSTDNRRNDTSSFLCEFADDTGGNPIHLLDHVKWHVEVYSDDSCNRRSQKAHQGADCLGRV